MRLVIDTKQNQYSSLFFKWLLRSLKMWLYSSLDKKKISTIDFKLLDSNLDSIGGVKILSIIIDSIELSRESNYVVIEIPPRKRYKGIPLVKLSNFIAYGCLGSSKYNLLPAMFNFVDLNISKIYEMYRRSHGMR